MFVAFYMTGFIFPAVLNPAPLYCNAMPVNVIHMTSRISVTVVIFFVNLAMIFGNLNYSVNVCIVGELINIWLLAGNIWK
jgi:hypothetical protein